MLPKIRWVLEDAAAIAAITLFVIALLQWAAIAEALVRQSRGARAAEPTMPAATYQLRGSIAPAAKAHR